VLSGPGVSSQGSPSRGGSIPVRDIRCPLFKRNGFPCQSIPDRHEQGVTDGDPVEPTSFDPAFGENTTSPTDPVRKFIRIETKPSVAFP
ncbi:hypothetical protein, partial [Azoarcus taiwanensis]|uniref:hypothetical protein n=1 Tax=Azoarcus taiwanensis TaxID=666964 RepID=UPI001B7CDDD9